MNHPRHPRRRCLTAMLASLLLVACSAPLLSAADNPASPALADKPLPALPLSATFGKGTPGENGGQYAVTLKNTGDKTLELSAKIIWSVASHNRAKTIQLPPKTLAAGETWIIDDLAVEDRVVIEAEGYATLDLKTPPGK